MSKLIALPVPCGDSFYLEREIIGEGTKRILVDGGKSPKNIKSPLSSLLITHTKLLDIIVCTHADSDHIQGLIELLNNSNNNKYTYSCSELWLPSQWLFAYELAFKEIDNKKLISKIKKKELENIANDNNLECPYSDIDQNRQNDPFTKDEINKITENVFGKNHYLFLNNNFTIDFINKLKDMVRLLSIATLRNIKLRWFKYSQTEKPSGGEWYLKPANAIEVKRNPSAFNNLILNAKVTACNIESLVFHSPITNLSDSKSHIVFSSDSTFNFSYKPNVSTYAIITVAHHGSSAHPLFYSWLASKNNVTLIRSDKINKIRPCSKYIQLPNNKFCTACNTASITTERKFIYRHNTWIIDCQCTNKPCISKCKCT